MRASVAFRRTCVLGEGALWDVAGQRLYWVDILSNQVFSFDPRTRVHECYEVASSPSAVVLDRSGKLLVALRQGVARFDPGSRSLTTLVDPEPDRPGNRLNDGKCDPRGRFWVGSIVEDGQRGGASLHRLDTELGISCQLPGLDNSNGLVWSRDGRTFFHIDTPTQCVRAFDFDPDAGTLSSPRVVFEFDPAEGAPDGMTIDEADHLWVALWGGGKVQRVDPRAGRVVFEVQVAASNTTSCAFGGADLDELFITTARVGLEEEQLQAEVDAGSVFSVRVPFRGVPAVRFAG